MKTQSKTLLECSQMQPEISIVTPVYGPPESLPVLVDEIKSTIDGMGLSFEVIMVDDRCPYGSWATITELAKENQEIVGIRLAKNRGQHPAIFAGLSFAKGKWVVVMDCDLQDVPAEIKNLYEKAQEGYDVVQARRVRRQDNAIRRGMSRFFYSVLSYLTGTKHNPEIANFGIYHSKVIQAMVSWNEDHRYFPTAVQWIGFESATLAVSHDKRQFGSSNYNFTKLFDLSMSIIVSFSDKPLRIMAFTGMIISTTVFIASIVYLIIALLVGFSVPGWSTVIISLWFLSGLLLSAIGLMGLYIGQIMREAKGRPNYVVDTIVRCDDYVGGS